MMPFVGLLMFGILSVPMGIFQDRIGKKSVLVLGLLVGLAGLLNASFGLTSFVRFLLTVTADGHVRHDAPGRRESHHARRFGGREVLAQSDLRPVRQGHRLAFRPADPGDRQPVAAELGGDLPDLCRRAGVTILLVLPLRVGCKTEGCAARHARLVPGAVGQRLRGDDGGGDLLLRRGGGGRQRPYSALS